MSDETQLQRFYIATMDEPFDRNSEACDDGNVVFYADAAERIAQLEAALKEAREALEAMIDERYSEFDMMSCKYKRGSTEIAAWEDGVRQVWKLWDLSKQPGVEALKKLKARAALAAKP